MRERLLKSAGVAFGVAVAYLFAVFLVGGNSFGSDWEPWVIGVPLTIIGSIVGLAAYIAVRYWWDWVKGDD